jgi:replicative DNA helicase
VKDHKSDLVVVGPVYRFTDSDLNTEEGVRSWQRAFEPLMADGVAVLTEHHAPNEHTGHTRMLRPIGSSAMRRWFSQGVSLRTAECEPHGERFCTSCPRSARVELWRGSRDEEVHWPTYLRGEQGRVWWTADEEQEVRGSRNVR